MAIENGSAFLLKIGDGAIPPAYRTVAGLRTTLLSVNGEAVNVTTKDSAGWRDLLSGAGVRSVSVSAAGIFTGSDAEVRLRGHALAGTIDDYRLSFESGERIDRKSVVEGKSVSVRVDLGGRRIIKKKKKTQMKNRGWKDDRK